MLSFSSDWLFPPDQSRDLVNALVANCAPVSYCNVQSDCGHDAFLLPNDLDRYGELVRAFLLNLGGTTAVPAPAAPGPSPTSIFQSCRLDYDRLLELIPSARQRTRSRLRSRDAVGAVAGARPPPVRSALNSTNNRSSRACAAVST